MTNSQEPRNPVSEGLIAAKRIGFPGYPAISLDVPEARAEWRALGWLIVEGLTRHEAVVGFNEYGALKNKT